MKTILDVISLALKRAFRLLKEEGFSQFKPLPDPPGYVPLQKAPWIIPRFKEAWRLYKETWKRDLDEISSNNSLVSAQEMERQKGAVDSILSDLKDSQDTGKGFLLTRLEVFKKSVDKFFEGYKKGIKEGI
eukprot:Sdes_comp16666_c0_seq1m5956